MNHAQEFIANIKASRGMNVAPTVNLYADDFAAENLPAQFIETEVYELATDAWLGPRVVYFVCELEWVMFGRKKMSRDEVVEIVEEKAVQGLEAERAEELS